MKKVILASGILLLSAGCNQNKVSIPETSNYTEPAPKQITASLSHRLLGSWQRVGLDQIVIYKEDGTADVYSKGKFQTSFKWQLDEGAQIITEFGSPNRLYKISKLTDNELELIYQYNGQTLKYTRK